MVDLERCLVPECEALSQTRGLCGSHYAIARNLVRDNKITWEQLEKEGKIKGQKRKSHEIATEWFLNGKALKK